MHRFLRYVTEYVYQLALLFFFWLEVNLCSLLPYGMLPFVCCVVACTLTKIEYCDQTRHIANCACHVVHCNAMIRRMARWCSPAGMIQDILQRDSKEYTKKYPWTENTRVAKCKSFLRSLKLTV